LTVKVIYSTYFYESI